MADIYLDIETSWDRGITVIGFHAEATGLVQLVAPDIDPGALVSALPGSGRLITFNGHAFDLPVIRAQLGVDLRSRYDSLDLRYLCKSAGLSGGQKAIEHILGIERDTEGVDGRQAMQLWAAWRRGSRAALDRLLAYNRDDVLGMVRLHRAAERRLARGSTR